MMNMFSMFDSNIMMMPMNILMTLMIVKNLKEKKYWSTNNNMKIFKNKINKVLMNNKNNKTMIEIMMPLSMMLMMMNLMNVIPNIMSMTSMMTFNYSMTMMIWMTMMIMSLKNYKILLMNLSPKNTPLYMMMIINVIEINSMLFQIISLTMRLSINMMMGHIIMKIMNNSIYMMIYLPIEMMVIMIQTYIFITLNMLNFNNTI